MLIVTRKSGQSVMIGTEVTVTVVSIKGNQVRIGVMAPKSVSVHREEVHKRLTNGEPEKDLLLAR